MSTNQSRQDELNALREWGVASNHRGKYSSSSSYLSPEDAAAFLSEQRAKRKSLVVPNPPKNLSSADLNDWYSLQRQRDLEERKRRGEAEAFLRGYRGFVDSNPKELNEQPIEKPLTVTSDAKSRVYSKVVTATPTVDDAVNVEDDDATLNSENGDTTNKYIDTGLVVAYTDSKKETGSEDVKTELPSKEENVDADIKITETIIPGSKKNDDKDQPNVPDTDVENETNNRDVKAEELTKEILKEVPKDIVADDETVEEMLAAEELEKVDVKEETARNEIVEGGSNETEYIEADVKIVVEDDTDKSIEEVDNDTSNSDVKEISELIGALSIEEKKDEESNTLEEVIEESTVIEDVVISEVKQWNGWISQDDDAKFLPESGRYLLYLSAACQYSHAVLLVRKLKGLEDTIGVTSLYVTWKERSCDSNTGKRDWVFAGEGTHDNLLKDKPVSWGEPDPLLNSMSLKDLYEAANDTTGEYTIPLLWDKKHNTIVSNNTFDIIRMMNSEFNSLCKAPELDLYPKNNRNAIDAVNEWIYPNLNNGVFRCGSSKTQEEYDQAIDDLTESFDRVGFILQRNRFLAGSSFSEADLRLFVTMLRFDEIYYISFKTNTRRVATCPPILNYIREIYQMVGVAETCDMDLIKTHHFTSYVDPKVPCIIPKGDGFIDLLHSPHDRNEFSYVE